DPHGGYEKGKYIVSFTGFLPADHPEFVGLVVLDDAKTSKPELNYGGLVAGPIFARIAEKAARYLDLAPQPDLIKRTAAGRVASTSAPGHWAIILILHTAQSSHPCHRATHAPKSK